MHPLIFPARNNRREDMQSRGNEECGTDIA